MIECDEALRARANIYKDQGLTDVPVEMISRADAYRNEAMVVGGSLGKSQEQVLLDIRDHLQSFGAETQKADTDEKRQKWLEQLNHTVDACFSSPVSTN